MSDFFDQLSIFSRRVFKKLGIEEVGCPWRSGPFRDGYPKGGIVHYTTGTDIHDTARWFMQRKRGARSSAHAIIADGWPENRHELCEDLPLIHALPAMVLQCVPPDRIAWHATWTNSMLYGIEAVNVGEVRRKEDGTFVSWHRKVPQAPEWTRPWNHPRKKAFELFGRWWEPWTAAQIQTICTLLNEVQELCGTLRPEWILGHENVQAVHTLRSRSGVRLPFNTDKRDPGPGFPLEAVRDTVLVDGAALFSCDPNYGSDLRTGWILDWWRPAERPPADVIWEHFQKIVMAYSQAPKFGAIGKLCLRILGYHVSDVTTGDLTEADLESVWIFQRMMGLETDRKPGPKTRRAIVERLVDRGFVTGRP